MDWSRIDRDAHLQAMERSSVCDEKIRRLLQTAQTDKVADRAIYMRGIDAPAITMKVIMPFVPKI